MTTYGPTIQCSSKILDYMSNVQNVHCPRVAITHILSLNHH